MKKHNSLDRLNAVRDWMVAFKQRTCKSFLDADTRDALARAELHREEFHEWSAACDEGHNVAQLDGLVDMEVIACGTQCKLGLNATELPTVPREGIYFYNARVVAELNKTQLCQSGLEISLNALRKCIEHEAKKAHFDFEGAFDEVMTNNWNKFWSADDIQTYMKRNPDDYKRMQIFVNPGHGKPAEANKWPVLHVVQRADGKVLKPPGHRPPDLEPYLLDSRK